MATEGKGAFIDAGKKAAAKRRRCAECGMVKSPGVIGVHQKASGHSGYEDLDRKG